MPIQERKLTKLEVYACDFLNRRTGPNTNYKIVGKLYPPQLVEVESTQGNWARIYYNGKYSWCSKRYLRTPLFNPLPSGVTAKLMKVHTYDIHIRKTAEWKSIEIDTKKIGEIIKVTEYKPAEEFSVCWYLNGYFYVPSKYLTDTGQLEGGVGGGEEDNNEGTFPGLPDFSEPVRHPVQYKNEWWIECYSNDYPNFFFNTANLRMPLLEKPVEQIEILKTDAIDTMLINGDIVYSSGTYNTTELEMEFYVLKENYNQVVYKLRQLTQMQDFRLILGWDRNYYKRARLNEEIEIEEVEGDDIAYKIVISFILQPFRYALDGSQYVKDRKGQGVDLGHNSEIFNPYSTSLPKMIIQVPHESLVPVNADNQRIINTVVWSEIDGISQEVTMFCHNKTHNGKPVKYLNIVVDSENELCYEDDTLVNYSNLLLLTSDFPVIKPGLNKIFQGTQQTNLDAKLRIIPNWREL